MVDEEYISLADERAAMSESEQREAQVSLAEILALIPLADSQQPPDYDSRYGLVMLAMNAAWMCGYPTGYRVDQADPAWPVAYIELPTGQVSWHMPQHVQPWDGHDTDAKYERVRQFVTPLLGEPG